jgi:phospholipid/cholesterol/gamma-HCH transport system substrate-binding protein
MIRSRYADEWVGLLVLLSVAVFFGVALQAGVLRDWFRPTSTLRIVLPESGVAGLSVGADVEILGTKAGTITRVVIDPSQQMHAEAAIDDQATAFVRRDSRAVIRRRFGVAGAAYVDILRGTGQQLDWTYAVIQAETERAPTETVGALIDEVRAKIFPVLDDAGHAMHSLSATMERVEQGQGTVGRLLVDDTLVRTVEATAADAQAAIADAQRMLAQMNAPDGGVPELLRRADQSLSSMQTAMRNLSEASERAPRIAHNVESTTANIPSLLTQTQQSAHELELTLAQLRRSWLLGGTAAGSQQPSARLPSTEVQP